MIMTNFLKSRKSVREFKNKKVNPNTLEKIQEVILELGKEENCENIKFKLYEDGDVIANSLRGTGGYSGVMIQSPHYITLELSNKEDKTLIYSSYFLEKLITKLNSLGLDTCWVSLKDVEEEKKKDIFNKSQGYIDYILAFGHSKLRNPFVPEPFSERIGVDELVSYKSIGRHLTMDELESRGLEDLFFYVRFAPSTMNKQPWRFLLDDNKVTLMLTYKEGEVPLLIDAGIIMYYFEALANTQGIKNKWKLVHESFKAEDSDIIYQTIAEYDL